MKSEFSVIIEARVLLELYQAATGKEISYHVDGEYYDIDDHERAALPPVLEARPSDMQPLIDAGLKVKGQDGYLTAVDSVKKIEAVRQPE